MRRSRSLPANDTRRGGLVVGSSPTRSRDTQLPDWVSRRLPRCRREGNCRSAQATSGPPWVSQPRSLGVASQPAPARALVRSREPRRRSPSHEIWRPRPSAHRRSPRTGVAQERCRRAPPTLSSRFAFSVAGIERRGPRGELPHRSGDRPGHAPRATTPLQLATVFQPTRRRLSPLTTRRRLIG